MFYINKLKRKFHDQKQNWNNINQITYRKKNTETKEVTYVAENYKGDLLTNSLIVTLLKSFHVLLNIFDIFFY